MLMAEWFECVIILSTRQTPVKWQHGQIYRQGMNRQNTSMINAQQNKLLSLGENTKLFRFIFQARTCVAKTSCRNFWSQIQPKNATLLIKSLKKNYHSWLAADGNVQVNWHAPGSSPQQKSKGQNMNGRLLLSRKS